MLYQLGTAVVEEKEKVILYFKDQYIDLDSLLARVKPALRINSLFEITQEWTYWTDQITNILSSTSTFNSEELLYEGDINWQAPILYPNKLICIGANYTDHIEEMGKEKTIIKPYSFLKPASTTLRGHRKKVTLPKASNMIDWEAELAVVIGKHAKNVKKEDALTYVAGYTLFNDLSDREAIVNSDGLGIDWVVHKAHDGFAPMGPLVTPALFIPDPQSLKIKLEVNNEIKQDSNTSKMIFTVAEIIEHLSSIMTLEPGDIIATGTPAGAGFARNEFLKSGDKVVVEIEKLGTLTTHIQ
ncbi:fumarylacetoacetate hydrolase family protein [Priestia megaterium]|uniref:fumarylacetoacetate hydrolase family protein n=1 Tax=Priestia megaterium TaxID=1404 RepID=UPI002E1C9C13|nr:fumarylacetoacetate hydrolase family protein [Priestia megaterium]